MADAYPPAPDPRSDEINTGQRLRVMTVKHADEALHRLIEDCGRWIDLHAYATGVDHLGHVAAGEQAWHHAKAMLAGQRSTTGPERSARAAQWARVVLNKSAAHRAALPQRASDTDYARALVAAVEQAEHFRGVEAPTPSAEELVSAATTKLISWPSPGHEAELAPILPEASPVLDDNALLHVRPSSTDARDTVADDALALLTATIGQIRRLLRMIDSVRHPAPDESANLPTRDMPEIEANTLLDIAVAIHRYRAADRTRLRDSVLRTLSPLSPPDTGQEQP
jgi:hypothetical protein